MIKFFRILHTNGLIQKKINITDIYQELKCGPMKDQVGLFIQHYINLLSCYFRNFLFSIT